MVTSMCYSTRAPRLRVNKCGNLISPSFTAEQEQTRTIYWNRPHAKHVTPSWFGESVGHFEGDTLIVDTIAVAVKPEAGSMGFFGTPHTGALHVVERYRFLSDGEKTVLAPPN